MATSTPVLTVGPIPVEAIIGKSFDDGTYTKINSMKIWYGDIVFAIQTEYVDSNGNNNNVWSPMHGTTPKDAHKIHIKLKYPDEFLISVSGTSTEFPTQIRTLIIQSNQYIYGPYGTPKEGAPPFSTASTGCKIVGFHGRSGVAMNSIGTYLVPHDIISIGPFGGTSGVQFDDGIHPIEKLEICYGEGFVWMRTTYGDGVVCGPIDGGTVVSVKFASDEYLISLSRYYTEGSNPVVCSLTFLSNKGKEYGPFGTTRGIPFSTSTTAGTGKIVGFHGTRSDDHEYIINSIATYFEPLPVLSALHANNSQTKP